MPYAPTAGAPLQISPFCRANVHYHSVNTGRDCCLEGGKTTTVHQTLQGLGGQDRSWPRASRHIPQQELVTRIEVPFLLPNHEKHERHEKLKITENSSALWPRTSRHIPQQELVTRLRSPNSGNKPRNTRKTRNLKHNRKQFRPLRGGTQRAEQAKRFLMGSPR